MSSQPSVISNPNPAPTQSSIPSLTPRESHWWAWAIRGIVAIVFGLFALMWPGLTLASLVTVFGAYIVVDGIFAIIEAFKRRATDPRWWALLLEGLISILAGAGAVLLPGAAAIAFTTLLGVWAVFTGVLEIIQAIRYRNEIKGEGWLIAGGVLSVLFGITLLLWPVSGAITLVWLMGGYAIAFGIVMIIMAFRSRAHSVTA